MNILKDNDELIREFNKMVARELVDESLVSNNFKKESIKRLNETLMFIATIIKQSETMSVQYRDVYLHFFRKYYDSERGIKRRLEKIFYGDLFEKDVLDDGKIVMKSEAINTLKAMKIQFESTQQESAQSQ